MTTITESDVAPVSAAQVRALQHADSITFHTQGQTSWIRCHKDEENSASGFAEQVDIDVQVTRVNNYGSTEPGEFGWSCFASPWGMPKYSEQAQTFIRHVKVNSRLAFVWTRDNHSPVTRDAGLYVDHLDVRVQRPSAHRPVTDEFRVATFVGLDNTARMVRPATRGWGR